MPLPYNLDFSADDRVLASGNSTGSISTWDAKTGNLLSSFNHSYSVVIALCFSPTKEGLLAYAAEDRTIRLYDFVTGREVRCFGGQPHIVQSLAFSLDGRFLASGDRHSGIRLWDTTWLSMRATIALDNLGRVVTHLQFGATEKNTLLCWTENGRLWVRDARDLKPIKEYAPTGVVNLLCAISPTGRQLAVVTRTGNLGVWDIAEEKEIELAAHGAGLPSFRRLSFSRGEEMVASAGEDMTVRLWDVRNRREAISLPAAPDEPICLAFNHSSSKLAVGLTNGTILLYDFLSP